MCISTVDCHVRTYLQHETDLCFKRPPWFFLKFPPNMSKSFPHCHVFVSSFPAMLDGVLKDLLPHILKTFPCPLICAWSIRTSMYYCTIERRGKHSAILKMLYLTIRQYIKILNLCKIVLYWLHVRLYSKAFYLGVWYGFYIISNCIALYHTVPHCIIWHCCIALYSLYDMVLCIAF